MVDSNRSTGVLRVTDWLLDGDGWPPGQLPPATGHPQPTLATATPQPRMGHLLVPFGDALLGQRLA
jgi:hypothetical protein